jgi:hypothetical protein
VPACVPMRRAGFNVTRTRLASSREVFTDHRSGPRRSSIAWGASDAYARRGLRLAPGQKCGDHDAAGYLAQVSALKRFFARLAEGA